jgi:hypothetical protein
LTVQYIGKNCQQTLINTLKLSQLLVLG